MFCKATRIAGSPVGDWHWDEFPWKDIPLVLIQNHMGKKPVHFPKVMVKIAYDTTAVFLMFKVEDRFVRAVARADQDNVYKDSCVEFFFTPSADISQGYFNLEMNCGGTMLLHFQEQPRKNKIVIPAGQCQQISRAHSMPRIVEPEINENVTWFIAYRVPIALLARYTKVVSPAPEVYWRVNFYKCADDSSQPHWLTWAPVDLPKPNFHHPQSFGRLQFE